ncbi:TetR/AcrR family transcriptional regulator [Microvirga subterranea]|uniref:TetR family transcriptional regulator n=1 Tax=Microvirga subterranea TaxID=186651 RepID=A0A370HV50_9HYPH|nr:TetR/AcrR family transcriptional regulator [Microvirga subterranea]RDI62396.1 TetR family transcriptional regulator [Microvirga subterranea]
MSLKKRPAKKAPARSENDRQARLQAILDAALDVFLDKGFAEARLDDVAARAGVAKGTIYLYVPSKQALFEALVQSGIGGALGTIEQKVLTLDMTAEEQFRALFAFLRQEVLGTRRLDIVRLFLREGSRFPELAEIYHREVISRGLALLRGIAERGVASGEFRSDEIVRFPQLAIAPGLMALIWTSLFQRLDPLDVAGMLDAHLALMMKALKGPPS